MSFLAARSALQRGDDVAFLLDSYLAGRDLKGPNHWNPHTFSQRYSKLYSGRTAETGS